jgi:hypothetical protein
MNANTTHQSIVIYYANIGGLHNCLIYSIVLEISVYTKNQLSFQPTLQAFLVFGIGY